MSDDHHDHDHDHAHGDGHHHHDHAPEAASPLVQISKKVLS